MVRWMVWWVWSCYVWRLGSLRATCSIWASRRSPDATLYLHWLFPGLPPCRAAGLLAKQSSNSAGTREIWGVAGPPGREDEGHALGVPSFVCCLISGRKRPTPPGTRAGNIPHREVNCWPKTGMHPVQSSSDGHASPQPTGRILAVLLTSRRETIDRCGKGALSISH
jgi:hypothetical protein